MVIWLRKFSHACLHIPESSMPMWDLLHSSCKRYLVLCLALWIGLELCQSVRSHGSLRADDVLTLYLLRKALVAITRRIPTLCESLWPLAT
jgi:hypothetical protein